MEFVFRAVGDMSAAAHAPLVYVGDQLGLFRAMADGAPIDAATLAGRTNTDERYVREWLGSQAASGYVNYDGDGRYHLEPEQAVALTDESSPACVLGGYEILLAMTAVVPRLMEAFRTGEGIGWGEQDPRLFHGTARFFRPGYEASLVQEWLPALDGMVARLEAGAKVADIGCGFGHSTMIMAAAFPNSRFTGFDAHGPSVEAAEKATAGRGLADRLSFEVATAKTFTGIGYDLICYFDCLHDMGDPVGALAYARKALSADGMVMLVEPYGSDDVADNLNAVGRMFYSASTMICTPASKSEEVGLALGAQAGPARTREVAEQAGFTRFRQAAATPFNLIYELRP